MGTIIVEHRDRLARFGTDMIDSMLQARVRQTHCHQRPRDSRRSGTGYDRDLDGLLCPTLREALRSQPGRQGIAGQPAARRCTKSAITRNHPAPTATARQESSSLAASPRGSEKYSARAVGIARAVYNLMVATHQLARNHGHGPWPSPMEMEKHFNELKQGDRCKKG